MGLKVKASSECRVVSFEVGVRDFAASIFFFTRTVAESFCSFSSRSFTCFFSSPIPDAHIRDEVNANRVREHLE